MGIFEKRFCTNRLLVQDTYMYMLLLVKSYFKNVVKFFQGYCHKKYHSQISLTPYIHMSPIFLWCHLKENMH